MGGESAAKVEFKSTVLKKLSFMMAFFVFLRFNEGCFRRF